MYYLLDTDICIFFLKGRYGLTQKFANTGLKNLFISEITVAELKYGAEKSDLPDTNREMVNNFILKFKQLSINAALDVYAKEKARLKKEGNLVDDFDLLIGSTAIV